MTSEAPRSRVFRGAVIAFVGSEATGKSTMITEAERALAGAAEVRRVHAGRPPSTLLTVVPHLFLPVLRRISPGNRSTHVDARRVEHGDDWLPVPPLLFAVRAVLLAHDRHRLLRRAHGEAVRGTVVLSDRYPSSVTGAPDSPQLARWAGCTAGRPLLSWLVRTETRLYATIPPADLVFHLWAPLDVTLQRNRDRPKTEPDSLVALRHHQAGSMRFDGCAVRRLDTTLPLSQSLSEVVRAVAQLVTDSSRQLGGASSI